MGCRISRIEDKTTSNHKSLKEGVLEIRIKDNKIKQKLTNIKVIKIKIIRLQNKMKAQANKKLVKIILKRKIVLINLIKKM